MVVGLQRLQERSLRILHLAQETDGQHLSVVEMLQTATTFPELHCLSHDVGRVGEILKCSINAAAARCMLE